MRVKLERVRKNTETLGGADFTASATNYQRIGNSLNFKLDLENLLKLRLTLEAASLELNQYDKRHLRARDVGVNIALFAQNRQDDTIGRLTVTID
jgi:hypothetical protein